MVTIAISSTTTSTLRRNLFCRSIISIFINLSIYARFFFFFNFFKVLLKSACLFFCSPHHIRVLVVYRLNLTFDDREKLFTNQIHIHTYYYVVLRTISKEPRTLQTRNDVKQQQKSRLKHWFKIVFMLQAMELNGTIQTEEIKQLSRFFSTLSTQLLCRSMAGSHLKSAIFLFLSLFLYFSIW